MAFIRSLSTRTTLLRCRHTPSFTYILHNDDNKTRSRNEDSFHETKTTLLQSRSFITGVNKRYADLFSSRSIGASFCRNMSTTVGGGSDKIELMSDVLIDPSVPVTVAVTQTAPAVNEVALASADSFFPVAALQHLIDSVHSVTGFNWWASIVLTTLLMRMAILPLAINQMKASTKLALLRPHLEEIKQEMQSKGMDPMAVALGQQKMQALFREYGVTPFTPFKGILIQGPFFISFFVAITTMAEKMPSFKSGGAYWFADLTTPDSLYVFPVLTALTFWITVESNMQEGMEGNPNTKIMKNISRFFALATVPLTMGFPKAIFCYWITSNVFSFFYGLTLKVPGVKKALGVPDLPVQPSKAAPESPFNMLAALKQAAAARQESAPSLPVEQTSSSLPKVVDQRISSSSVLSQRLRSLEKQVKSKKNKRR